MNRPEAPLTEPWQAEALATALALQEAGVITPREWSEALGAAIRRAQQAGDPDRGDTYYLHVLGALEQLLAERGLISSDALARRVDAWAAAYRRTPHGQPVELSAPER